MQYFQASTRRLSLERSALVFLGLCILIHYLVVLAVPPDATAARSKLGDIESPQHIPVAVAGLGKANLIGADLRLVSQNSARVMRIPSVSVLSKAFDTVDYQLLGVMRGGNAVPRLFLTSLPHDLPEIGSVEARKQLFIKSILPLV